MANERVERNWKMANAASDNVTRPVSDVYRNNYARIKWKKTSPPTKKRSK